LRLGLRTKSAFLIMFLFFSFKKNAASAHKFGEDSFSFAHYIPDILTWVAIVLVGLIWVKIIAYFVKEKNSKGTIRSITAIISLILWFVVIGIQHWVLNQYYPLLDKITYTIGLLVLPFALISLWRLISLQAYKYLRIILKKPRSLLIFLGVLFLYSMFYLFASGLFSASWLALPSADDVPVHSKGFLIFSQTYGPLTMWYTVDFWIPIFKIYGVLSIGTFLLMLAVSIFMATNAVLLLYSWKLKKDKIKSMKSLVGATGSSSAIAGTSFCCCCLPALYPVMSLLFGSAAAETLSIALIDSSGPLFNMIQIGLLSLMTLSVLTISKAIKSMEEDLCEL
jgi:hypothetical protein